jgi:two-component system, chemotaxis family, protein-glutamate methylesterase/glutaminase
MRARYDLVVLGASAGGVEVLMKLARALPPSFPAPMVIVLHVSGDSTLPEILARVSAVPVSHARHGEHLLPGRVYVAPPDRHLTVQDGALLVTRGPRENGHRPAIDPLFRSAARAHRERVIGVVLSGQLDDGSAGLLAIKSRGGVTIVQDPDDAAFPSMPRNAIRYVDVDHVLAADRIVPALLELIEGGRMKGGKRAAATTRKKTRPSQRRLSAARIAGRQGSDTLVCPECQGPLERVDSGPLTQWTCAVGHSFSPESLTEAQTDALERVLWMAVRTLTERAQVQRQTTGRLSGAAAERMRERGEATAQDVELIRSILDRL